MIYSKELAQKVSNAVRDVPDFPREGIVFKDITPLLGMPALMEEVVSAAASELMLACPDVQSIAGIEARGFIFGSLLAHKLNLPFVPVRKAGKLPWKTESITYDLEYGSASIEIHEDALVEREKVVVVDDLLATGGTAEAAYHLLKSVGGEVLGYSFVIELTFLGGRKLLEQNAPVLSLLNIE